MLKFKLTLKTWWEGLSNRERFVLQCGFLTILVLVYYEIFWVHINTEMKNTQKKITEDLNKWQIINRSIAQIQYNKIQDTKLKKTSLSEDSLLLVIQQKINELDFSPSPIINKIAAKEVTMTFKNTSFNKLSNWLVNFYNQYNFNVLSATINQTKKSGLVNAVLILTIK